MCAGHIIMKRVVWYVCMHVLGLHGVGGGRGELHATHRVWWSCVGRWSGGL